MNKKNLYILTISTITLLCLFIQCAYLNTLYNAKAAYTKALKTQQKLIKINADTVNNLPDEIKKGYERTFTKADKVLRVYPKSKKWHDDAELLKAKATYYLKDYSLAARMFAQFIKDYPQSPFIPEAYLFLGKSYLDNENLQKAEETFLLILEKYPNLNNDEEITFLLGEVAIKREGKSKAMLILEKSLASVKSEEKKMNITIKLCNIYIDLKLYSKAISLLQKAPRNKKYPYYLYKMDYTLLLCYKYQKDFKKAVDLIAIMLKNKQYLIYKYEIMLEKAIITKMTGNRKLAIKILTEIVTAQKGSAQTQAKASLELAYIYQYELGDFVKAKEYYDKVLSLSNDEKLKQIADTKIKGIELMLQYTESIKKTKSINKGKALPDTVFSTYYKLGEVYWLNLDEPDSALNYFTVISKDTSADSAIVMKSIYARAWIHRFIKNDSTASDSLYKVLIARYPTSIVAKKSQQDIGVPVTVITHVDSAQMAFIEAERLLYDENNTVAAINSYYKVYKTYPDLKDLAAKSLYTAAWLCDDVLNKNKKAMELYQQLCDTFPESEYCTQKAKPRLQIVEDTMKIIKKEEALQNKKKKGSTETPKPVKSEEVIEKENIIEKPAVDTVKTISIEKPVRIDTLKTLSPDNKKENK